MSDCEREHFFEFAGGKSQNKKITGGSCESHDTGYGFVVNVHSEESECDNDDREWQDVGEKDGFHTESFLHKHFHLFADAVCPVCGGAVNQFLLCVSGRAKAFRLAC